MSMQAAKPIMKCVDTIFCEQNTAPLTLQFMPLAQKVLGHLGVLVRFNALAGKWAGTGMLSKDKLQVEGRLTGKTFVSLCCMIGEEEKKFRLNPTKTGSEQLSKVFGSLR